MLIDIGVLGGLNRRPEVTAAPSSHGDNPLTASPQRATVATAAATITETASPSSVPAAAGSTGSGSRATNSPVNPTRNPSAPARTLRTQPRTVAAGRPNRTATRRCPQPAADNTSPAPITPASSARRHKPLTGNNTCVTPQPTHRARRGRHRDTDPSRPRNTRGRA